MPTGNKGMINQLSNNMFVQGIQFSTTISHQLKFRTIKSLQYSRKKEAKKEDIINGLNKVIQLYHARGLTVETIQADNEFECGMEGGRDGGLEAYIVEYSRS